MTAEFSTEQKRYLEGLVSGIQVSRAAQGPKPLGTDGAPGSAGVATGPDAIHFKAQDRTTASGNKLADQENWKREEHPFDAYPRLRAQAASGVFPKPPDNFRWRYHGLFYVAPAQNSYMCRLRIANGILSHWQFEAVANLAERFGGGFTHVTTRANLQVRDIAAENAVNVVEAVQDAGLTARGAGADNIRNVTGSATAGIDDQELLDTRPFAREWHHHILNDRSLYGLPRKFNVAFDGGGKVAALEETNDIGFQAVETLEGASVEPGVYFRLVLGGITGHKDLARDTGVVLALHDATAVADAIVRVFIENGDRTNRNKSRLKYVLDAWGFEKFLTAVEGKLGRQLTRVDAAFVKPRPQANRLAHLGIHAQKQTGLNWIGVVVPVGRLTCQQMRGLSTISRTLGDGDIRLTVWQNVLISGVTDTNVEAVTQAIEALGLSTKPTAIRAGLVACTGSTGCKFAASNTKDTAELIARHVEASIDLDSPVNIHLTGCHHSCAQHYIGDIGLIGARVPVGDDGDTVDGFHVVVGGGTGANARIGEELLRDIKTEECPAAVLRILSTYLRHRSSAAEEFQAFTARLGVSGLTAMMETDPK